jgi:hypothetical protein
MVAFEDAAAANDWTVSQAIRVLARRGLVTRTEPAHEETRERFEEAP